MALRSTPQELGVRVDLGHPAAMSRPPSPRWYCWLGGVTLLAACQPSEGDAAAVAVHEPAPALAGPGDESPAAAHGPSDGSAQRLLAALAVKGRAPRSGYTREQFGRAWADVDRNGCDTRDDILRRDLKDPTFKPGARACVVLTGLLADPYTGAEIPFEHGVSSVDIDHVVALGDAWVKGAAYWPPERRLALANDPLNLLAVDASANRSKGDGDAATWLPPSRAYRCKYVARQISVKTKYALWLTAAEHDAMATLLAACPGETVPVGDAPTSAPIVPAEPRAPRPAPQPATAGESADPNYGTCKQAIAAGKGPYFQDRDPEYAYYNDRDRDGIVCER
jgi:hypothetical protein